MRYHQVSRRLGGMLWQTNSSLWFPRSVTLMVLPLIIEHHLTSYWKIPPKRKSSTKSSTRRRLGIEYPLAVPGNPYRSGRISTVDLLLKTPDSLGVLILRAFSFALLADFESFELVDHRCRSSLLINQSISKLHKPVACTINKLLP